MSTPLLIPYFSLANIINPFHHLLSEQELWQCYKNGFLVCSWAPVCLWVELSFCGLYYVHSEDATKGMCKSLSSSFLSSFILWTPFLLHVFFLPARLPIAYFSLTSCYRLNWVPLPPTKYVDVLTFSVCEYHLIWKLWSFQISFKTVSLE